MTASRDTAAEIARTVLGAPRTTAALTSCGLGFGFLAFAGRQTMGTPAVIAALAVLLALMLASLLVRRREIEWRGILPLSLLGYLGWAGVSIFWSQYQWATLGALAYLGAFTVVGAFVALSRETIQIVRSMGDVLRVVLLASMAVEVLSGLLIDTPIPFLGVRGLLAEGGPITGLAETSDALALAAVIGAVTFVIEWRMRSVTRPVAIGSIALAALVLLFTGSGVAVLTVPLVVAAAAGLYAIRQTPSRGRGAVQGITLGIAAAGLVVAWLFRSELLAAFGVAGEFDARIRLWRRVIDVASGRALEGIGWIGRWNTELPPYRELVSFLSPHPSAENAYLDLFLQLGVVGVVAFCGLAGLAFVRSWLLASRRRTVAYAWPALVLVALVIVSISSSAVLVEAGWTLLVVCVIKASGELSWRQALAGSTGAEASEPPR